MKNMMTPWKKRKLIKRFSEGFGKKPDTDYYAGDMECIRTYYDACQKDDRDPFYVDETTWHDLDLETLYKQINTCQSTSGEQYLYYMLRRPMTENIYRHQLGLIHLFRERSDIRIKIQLLLNKIGNYRHIDLTSVFHPKETSSFWLVLYSLLGLLLFISVLVAMFFVRALIVIPMILFVFNPLFHELRRAKCEHEIHRVNYCVSLALALRKMQKWKIKELDAYLFDVYKHLGPMRAVLRSGPVMSRMNSDPVQAAMINFFMLDLVSFEILKKRLAKYHDHFLAIHEAIGRLDASIAIASYRASLNRWCEPEIEYSSIQPTMEAKSIVHPLLKEPIHNDLTLEKSLLITGSNASGKSTYLRSSMLCALMAETLCTCTCENYKGSFFQIYTSIALSDDLQAGESYYIAEIRSLKRILDAQKHDGFILCALDEVLRGTNTIERISASAEILKALDQPGTLCLIATHDVELCSLIGERYQLAHFEETVTEDDISFDYKLKPGPAESRNAIHLLKLMGFDQSIVDAAHSRADHYIKTGKWM